MIKTTSPPSQNCLGRSDGKQIVFNGEITTIALQYDNALASVFVFCVLFTFYTLACVLSLFFYCCTSYDNLSGSPAGELAPQVTEGFSINLMKLQPLRHGFAVPPPLKWRQCGRSQSASPRGEAVTK